MRVLDVYSKKDLDILTCDGLIVSDVMNKFFSKFPKIYRENYDRNLLNLEIWRIDEHFDGLTAGEYFHQYNILLIQNLNSLIHELMHVASRDSVTGRSAFCKNKDEYLFEYAMLEGMTEYLSSMAKESTPSDYFFETFVISMLSNIDGLFEGYFRCSYDKLISLFPNKRDIISLMYSLNFYYNKNVEVINGEVLGDYDRTRISRAVSDVIDTVIDIQVSLKMGKRANRIYAEKFMDLLSCEVMEDCVGCYKDDYIDYANEQLNKRILRRL